MRQGVAPDEDRPAYRPGFLIYPDVPAFRSCFKQALLSGGCWSVQIQMRRSVDGRRSSYLHAPPVIHVKSCSMFSSRSKPDQTYA